MKSETDANLISQLTPEETAQVSGAETIVDRVVDFLHRVSDALDGRDHQTDCQ